MRNGGIPIRDWVFATADALKRCGQMEFFDVELGVERSMRWQEARDWADRNWVLVVHEHNRRVIG